MDRAGLADGEVYPVRAACSATTGQIVVVRQGDGMLIVKRYVQTSPVPGFSGGWIVPQSSDPKWQPRPLGEDDTIVGIVQGPPRDPLAALQGLLKWGSEMQQAIVPRATDEEWSDDVGKSASFSDMPTARDEARYRRERNRNGSS